MAQIQLMPEDAAISQELILLQACAKLKGFSHQFSEHLDMSLLIYNMQVFWPSHRATKKILPCVSLKLCLRHAIGESTKQDFQIFIKHSSTLKALNLTFER